MSIGARQGWRWQEPVDQASDQTLQMQLDNLELRFQTIDKNALTSDQARKTYDKIAAAFSRRHADQSSESDNVKPLKWDDASHLESQIGSLMQGDRLRQEIAARMRWAVADGVPQAAALQIGYVDLVKSLGQETPLTADASLQDFLRELMEAIHWHSKHKFISRKMRGQATRRTLLMGLFGLLVALWPYFALPSMLAANTRQASLASSQIVEVAAGALFSSSSDFWAHFALYTGLTFGFLGALFSRLITLQRQWSNMAIDELFNARSYHYIVLRASIGILGALVVYFFLQSGLMDGKVFPKFKELTMDTQLFSNTESARWPARLILPSADLALLIMWSFIAGFSESLVPTVLSNTERQFAAGTTATRT